ncbi:hypothetical protein BDV38DRAFT_233083 [Aspergillus pseudotamarii]|uniref:Uncharacterized protein n=1 Tax=Aspergillus pseudotamarii TaxID=132259 RepID=A0A5N6TAS9_ASPPS|nr:uncharacterized protein BDV38DRAFT_233083 [Aspergillus pseudotamarii]KAE8143241.1 hypothetical protein BDV38DRAFT_233083 [Aspergillus pseudotamarii]
MSTPLAPRLASRAHSHLIRLTTLSITTRSLSTKAMIQKKEFLCIMPDKPNVQGLRKQVKG